MNWAIDESLTPVAEKHHCVLFHLFDKVDNELKHLFDAGTIEPVNDFYIYIYIYKNINIQYNTRN